MLALTEENLEVPHLDNGFSIFYGRNGSCSDLSQDSYIAECRTSLAFVWVGLFLGIVGVVGNSHIVWCYGFYRRLRTNSDQLAFTYGFMDSVSCGFAVLVCILALRETERAFCLFYVVFYILMSRTALHLVLVTSINRFYTACLRESSRKFVGLIRRVKPALMFILFSSLTEMFLQGYVICVKYDNIGVLFVKKLADNESNNWSLIVIDVLNWLNWTILVVGAIASVIAYEKIQKAQNSGKDVCFEDPIYDIFHERAITQMFKRATILYFIGLFIQVVFQIMDYYFTFRNAGNVYLSVNFLVLSKVLADFLNLSLYTITPFLFYAYNAQFRDEVRVFWRYKMWLTKDLFARYQQRRSLRLLSVAAQEDRRASLEAQNYKIKAINED